MKSGIDGVLHFRNGGSESGDSSLMNWLDRAEVKFGHLAIPGLVRIVVAFNTLVFALSIFSPNFIDLLELDINRVMHGEVWRLVTYIFIPSFGGGTFGLLFLLFYLMFLWFVGNALEQAMGSFKLNVFYFLGMLCTTIGACIARETAFSNGMLNSTLLFACAHFYPDLIISIWGIIPVKLKWVAWFTGALIAFAFIFDTWIGRLATIAAMGNYLIFFGPEMLRNARHRSEVQTRRRRFERDMNVDSPLSLHRCVVCGRTEHSSPHLHFRVSKDGNEYCMDHLPKVQKQPGE